MEKGGFCLCRCHIDKGDCDITSCCPQSGRIFKEWEEKLDPKKKAEIIKTFIREADGATAAKSSFSVVREILPALAIPDHVRDFTIKELLAVDYKRGILDDPDYTEMAKNLLERLL